MAGRVLGMSTETAGGVALATGAVLGLVFENTAVLAPIYDQLLDLTTTVAIGENAISKPLLLWINDGLMAVFFLLVALEIKREVKKGALATWNQAALPVYGAIGGLILPALIFIGIVGIDSMEAKGWAIPAATDIAFALGVLSLFGSRVPPILKTFLLALAVVDDLAAIVIIALFYTSELSLMALATAGLLLASLTALNLAGVKRGAPYIILGIILWAAVLKSGVHATLAGVALGFAIPLEPDARGRSMGERYEHGLHPWSAFLIMPVFAFANAGVPLAGLTFADLAQPLTMGVALGLFLGKQVGIFGLVWLAVRAGLAAKPDQVSWLQIYAAALIAGIGFTMSLFIGGLAFEDPAHQNLVRLGVLAGSLTSGVCGAALLAIATRAPAKPFKV